jgi:hypothetical protein
MVGVLGARRRHRANGRPSNVADPSGRFAVVLMKRSPALRLNLSRSLSRSVLRVGSREFFGSARRGASGLAGRRMVREPPGLARVAVTRRDGAEISA